MDSLQADALAAGNNHIGSFCLSQQLSSPRSLFALPLCCNFSCLPPPPPSLLSHSARSSLLSTETASLPFSFPSRVLPNPVSLPGQRETLVWLSSCPRGSRAFLNHFDSATDHSGQSSFPPLPHPLGKLNHCGMRLKKLNLKGEEMWWD